MPTPRCHPGRHGGSPQQNLDGKASRRAGSHARSAAYLLLGLLLMPAAMSASALTRASGDRPETAVERTAVPVAPRPQRAGSVEYPRLAQASPVLHAARVFVMEPGSEIPLPIQVEAMPRNSFLRLRGLPPSATLSEGHQIGPGAWAVPLVSLPNIRVRVPPDTSGRFEVSINAVNVAGDVLNEITTTLVVASSSSLLTDLGKQLEPPAPVVPPQPPAPALAARTEPEPPSVPAAEEPRARSGGSTAPAPVVSGSAANIRPPSPDASSKGCGAAEITTTPLPAGRMEIKIDGTSCRGNEPVTIDYAGASLVRELDAAGSLVLTLDCFAGTSSKVLISFADGARGALDVAALDLGRLSKVAVIWNAPINLDLHAYEYAAEHGEPGHIWASSPSSPDDAWEKTLATGRGHGFITADDRTGEGEKFEVYTLWHQEDQTSGAIELALDFESRGDTPSGEMCGRGQLSEVAFEIVMLSRHGDVTRQEAVMLPMECGATLAHSARYNKSIIPVLRIRR